MIDSTGTKGLHGDRPRRAVRRRQHPRLVHQLGRRDPASPRPWMVCARHDERRKSSKRNSKPNRSSATKSVSPRDQQVDVTLAQFTVQRLRGVGHEMKGDARIALRELDRSPRKQSLRRNDGASNPHVASRRVGEKLDVIHGLAQFIEHRCPAVEQGAAVFGRLDALAVRSSRRTPRVSSSSAIDLEIEGWVDIEVRAAFRMLPARTTAIRT